MRYLLSSYWDFEQQTSRARGGKSYGGTFARTSSKDSFRQPGVRTGGIRLFYGLYQPAPFQYLFWPCRKLQHTTPHRWCSGEAPKDSIPVLSSTGWAATIQRWWDVARRNAARKRREARDCSRQRKGIAHSLRLLYRSMFRALFSTLPALFVLILARLHLRMKN